MSYDYTGRRLVLRGRLDWVWQVQARLIHCQAGALARRHSLLQASEECRDKDLPEGLLYWAKFFPYSWGHPLQKMGGRNKQRRR